MTWEIHRQLWGRSAGFPARLGDALVSEDAARAAAEARAAHPRAAAVDAELRAMLAAVDADLSPDDRRRARRIRRAIAAGRDVLAGGDPLVPGLDRARWAALVAERAEHRAAGAAAAAACRETVARARERERAALRRLLLEPRARTAAALTSRSLADGLARGLGGDAPPRGGAAGPPAGAPASPIERRALLFLQRLTAKPAMLADAGPCFWGTVDPDERAPLRVDAGPDLVRARRVTFEHWAILALARRIQADPEIAPHCVLRLNPGCLLDGSTLFYPIGHRLRLEPREAQVLRWCTEGRTLGEVRRAIAAHPPDERAELERLLGNHLKSGVAHHDIPVPAAPGSPGAPGLAGAPAAPGSDDALRAFLAGLPDACAAKGRWLATLDELAALRDELARDPRPAPRRAATERLDAAFRAAAGVPPTRNPGQLHGARFVTYEDCARDADVIAGGPLRRDLADLAPALELASWVARACAARYEQKLLPIHARLARNLDGVDFVTFIRETQWITETPEVITSLRRDLRRAWEAQLGERLDAGGPLELAPADFRGVLARLEAADATGDATAEPGAPAARATAPWLPAADCHGLSVHAAAASPDALARGDYRLVLDKLYKGVPVWIHPAALAFCPDPAAALAAFEAWSRGPLLQLVDTPASYHRSNLNLPLAANLWEVTLPHATSRAPRERVVPCSELEVAQDRGRLVVRSHDRRVEAGLFLVRWPFLQQKLLGIPIHPEAPELDRAHRVTLGRWILARDQWRFDAAPLARRWDRACPLPAIAAWQAEHGIPDRIFVKVPEQPKSVALDLRSALQCDLLRALAARTGELRVTEMLPAPDQCWLTDRSGAAYVAELRFTALRRDPAHSRPTSHPPNPHDPRRR